MSEATTGQMRQMLSSCHCPGGVHPHRLDILGSPMAVLAWTLEPEGPSSSPSHWADVSETSLLTLHRSARLGDTVGQGRAGYRQLRAPSIPWHMGAP